MESYSGTFKPLGRPPDSSYFEIKWTKQILDLVETGSVISSPGFKTNVRILSCFSHLLMGFMALFIVLKATRLFALLIVLFQSFQWVLMVLQVFSGLGTSLP